MKKQKIADTSKKKRNGASRHSSKMRAKNPVANNFERKGRKNDSVYSKILDGETVCGTIEGNSNGFAFLIRDDLGKDVFIAPHSLNGAIHGDRVRATLNQRQNGKQEAIITEVLESCRRVLIGTYISEMKGRGFVICDEKRIPFDIGIEQKHNLNASNGDRVLVEVIGRKEGLYGKITRVFKESDAIDWDIFSIIVSHNLKDEFGAEVLREVSKISEEISQDEIDARRDFRNSLTVTIDGDDSRDFDDAVSLTKNDDIYELTVHIADVSHYVRAGSYLDKEAFQRGTSVYFPNSFIPMLPEKICNNVCSLMENSDRLTLSVIMQINSNGKILKHRIVNGVIRSTKRLTYKIVQKILDADGSDIGEFSEIAPMLLQMRELALILNKKRKSRGAIDFDLPETEIIIGTDGSVQDVRKAPRLFSHRIIEEFMLVTNETVAEHMNKLLAPFVYRGHLPPNELKMDSFIEFLAAVGVTWNNSEPVVPMDYSRLLAGLPENLSNIVNMMALRSMTKAAYFPQNKGHFGLASEFYCHFTAPIRRYPDLLIHRIIKDFLEKGKKSFQKYSEYVAEASTQSSLTERQADEAEREVEDVYKARFMSNKIGEVFDGIISGVTEWGVYVQLDNTVEGLVKKESLPGGDYSYNPVIMSLSNMTHIYKPGDKMKIKVASVTKNKVDFEPEA